jgi:DNA invertase Pin-like site-specific DNA recombinase
MSTNSNGRPSRFAAIVRVSAEQQEKRGESLRTQRAQIESAVQVLGGKVTRWYAGQEHATAGWEREQRDKMLAEAERKERPFDAVMVAHEDRWSRDDTRSGTDLDVLKRAGVKFFILTSEQDLTNPTTRLYLGMSALIGAYHARNQKKRSLENRIARAKRGLPTTGRVPFGRLWDEKGQVWVIDPVKQAMVTDVATRYLAGEALPKLAKEYGVNHSNLCKVLRERCGSQWDMQFNVEEPNIRETVTLTIPPLLPDETIKAVLQRLKANRTYMHKPPVSVHSYLLSGRVFCATCGYGMFGQTNVQGKRYYRHAHMERVRDCPLRPRPWVRADQIEKSVLMDLFNMLGNPAAIERAVRAAVPDQARELKRKARLEGELNKVKQALGRLVDAVADGLFTPEQVRQKREELDGRQTDLRAELDELLATLADVPGEEAIRLSCDNFGTAENPSIVVYDDEGENYLGGNDIATWMDMMGAKDDKDRRVLIEAVLTGCLPDGKPAGVYISPTGGIPHRGRSYTYELRGRLNWCVKRRVLNCRAPGLRPRRSCGRPAPPAE